MKFEYSQSVNNWFKDFPRTFKMVCGPGITELGGPWTAGSRIVLAQTPLSKVHDGEYRTGCHLPDYKIIYTDTADDDDFKIKYIEYGWGSFLKSDGANYFLLVEKYCELISGYNGVTKVFQKTKVLETEIPKTTSLFGPVAPEEPPKIIPVYSEWAKVRYSQTLYPDEIDLGLFAVNLIGAYGKFANPPVPYTKHDPDFDEFQNFETPTVVSSRIEINNTLFNSWWSDYSKMQPYHFRYANDDGFRDWLVSFCYAPDRFGIYMFFYTFSLGGTYVIGGPSNYVVTETLCYAFLITELWWRGSDVISQIRDSLVNRPWVMPTGNGCFL